MTRRADEEDDFEPDVDRILDFACEPNDDELISPDHDDPEPDDELVLRLLRGTIRVDPKSLLVRYLTAEEERESRKALTSLLYSGMRAQLPDNRREELFHHACFLLAGWLDPDERSKWKVVFRKPKGAISQHERNIPIVHEVQELYTQSRLSVEKAIARVAAKHKLSESAVRKLWNGGWGKLCRKLQRMLPPNRD